LFEAIQYQAEDKRMGAHLIEMRALIFLKTNLPCEDLKRTKEFNFPNATIARTGLIPGLLIYPNFVTPQEDAAITASLDDETENPWEKLLNRKVKHFGYRFKYGTNDVDKEKSMGTMPEFLHPLQPSK
jgi:hypothetical protein